MSCLLTSGAVYAADASNDEVSALAVVPVHAQQVMASPLLEEGTSPAPTCEKEETASSDYTLPGTFVGGIFSKVCAAVGRNIGGRVFEAQEIARLNDLYAHASTFQKAAINANWANACETAYQKGTFVGGIAGNFGAQVAWNLGARAMDGTLFSKDTLHDMMDRACEAGIREALASSTEAFVTTSLHYVLRTYGIDTLVWGASSAGLGPTAFMVAVPLSMALNNSEVVDTAVHMAYNHAASLTYNAGCWAAANAYTGASHAASLGYSAASSLSQSAYNGVWGCAQSVSSWWYKKASPAVNTAVSHASMMAPAMPGKDNAPSLQGVRALAAAAA